jgi:hypothetical protein
LRNPEIQDSQLRRGYIVFGSVRLSSKGFVSLLWNLSSSKRTCERQDVEAVSYSQSILLRSTVSLEQLLSTLLVLHFEK